MLGPAEMAADYGEMMFPFPSLLSDAQIRSGLEEALATHATITHKGRRLGRVSLLVGASQEVPPPSMRSHCIDCTTRGCRLMYVFLCYSVGAASRVHLGHNLRTLLAC